ncbi:ATP-dependent helicase HRQ1 [Candida viswanathii]|uniref:ATP-dependent helicase HRQ1 n=1 Tax=Candida viswanathii TaxID=5486 RepID=A0A367YGN8_9ASCO|nr:ATP-dependent helicase HRQ1 [Candida viswanathii]
MSDSSSWSPFFQRIARIFSEINTHLTFLASHSRSVIPSLDLLQKLNSSITPLELSIYTYLFPEGEIFFDYVDENQVMLSFVEEVKVDDQGYHQTAIAEKYDEHTRHSKQILIFTFQDAKVHGIGSMLKGPAKKRRKGNDGDYKSEQRQGFFLDDSRFQLQPLSKQHLTNLIKNRNAKFTRLLQKFIDKCADQDEAEKKLVDAATKRIPEEPNLEDMVKVLEQKKSVTPETSVTLTTDEMIDALKESKFYEEQIASVQLLNEERPAEHQSLLADVQKLVHPELKEALLRTKGISIDDGLYCHQATALNTLLDPSNNSQVIASTLTASGKSLIYQLPVLNSILWDISNGLHGRTTTAFFIFPTKALAQDQMRHFKDFIRELPSVSDRPIIVNTYDGDTPFKERMKILKDSDIIFTNPDTIHASILPGHSFDNWREFIRSLKFVVMDELHVYKGTFGINVGFVMARLARIKDRFLVEDPIRFISCSATIQNPISHFKVVCALQDDALIVHVDKDGSPCCEKKMVVWNPPALMNQRGEKEKSPDQLVPRVSMVRELARLLLNVLTCNDNLRVIVFCPIRVICEMLMKETRHLLQDAFSKSGIVQSDIMAYRGGYSKEDRRVIERKMFDGQLRAIVATNALELGIDLSHLDVVITCGFPMLKLNLHQQFGRAGRRRNAKGSLAIFVPGKSPVDQYYLENPHELIGKHYEDLCVEGLRNIECGRMILEKHLQCAAYEEGVTLDDMHWFMPNGPESAFKSILDENLILDVDGAYKTHPKYTAKPHRDVSIRAIEEPAFAVVDITNNRNIVIEEIELLRTTFTLYEGGIFLHQGQPYLIKEFNHQDGYAKVERVNVDWTTLQRDYTDVDPEEVECVKPLYPVSAPAALDIPAFSGKIKITMKVFGFFKVNRREEILEVVEVNNPPVIAHSKGFWLNVPNEALEVIYSKQLSAAGGIHAAAHAIMNMLPVHINGAPENGRHVADMELSTECKSPIKEFAARDTSRKRPARLVFYDTKGGTAGTGLSYKCFECIDEVLQATFNRVKNCGCEWGCPLCVVSSTCKEQMRVLSRPAALVVLAAFMGMDLETLKEELPDGPEPHLPEITTETIVNANTTVKFSPNVKIMNVIRRRA